MNKNLKQKSIDGVIWTLTEKFGIQLIKLVLGVILARLLTPADYGLIGMITVFFAIASIFIDSGFGMAYIQKKGANEEDASTIFYFNLVVSAFFYIVIWFVAPLISNFYGQPLTSLIRVMSIILILNSFGLIQLTKLKKDVNFKKKTILVLVSAILATLAGITAALFNYGVWSLVIQEVVRAIVKNVCLWIFYKWRPLLYFNFSSLKSLFSFSSWALLIGIINTIFDNIYVLVIGKFFPAAQLGFYTKANQFQGMVSKQPSNGIGAVAFPVFSKLQDDHLALKNAIRKFNRHSTFFIVPIAAVFFVIAEPFFLILLTEKWLPMVPYFQLLLISGVLYPLHMVNVQVLSAQGKMKLSFNISMIKNILRVINIIVMYRFGVLYIIYGEILFSFLALIINTYYTKRLVNYGMISQLKDISTILLISVLLVVVGFMIEGELNNPYLKIIISTLFISTFYLVGMYYLSKQLLFDNLSIIKKKFIKSK